MAENDEKSLIGFDPLAWLNEDEDTADHLQTEKKLSQAAESIEVETDLSDEAPKFSEDDDNSVVLEDETASTVIEDVSQGLLLDSVLGIQNVTELQQKLKALLSGTKTVIDIDASNVTHIDAASIQLLVVFKKAVVSQGKELNIDFPSENLIESCQLLGVSEILGLNQASGFF
jgi:ABC-type transporter Mla MlaB component